MPMFEASMEANDEGRDEGRTADEDHPSAGSRGQGTAAAGETGRARAAGCRAGGKAGPDPEFDAVAGKPLEGLEQTEFDARRPGDPRALDEVSATRSG